LADFLPNWTFRGVFFKYHFYHWKYQRSCYSMGTLYFFASVVHAVDYTGAHTVIFCGIFLYIIHQMEQAKLQWAERGWGAGKEDIIYLGCRIA
jgi:hypothetical protein